MCLALEALEGRWVPSGNPPTAVDDSFSVTANQTLTANVLANDSDPENDPLTPVQTAMPGHGYGWFDGMTHNFMYMPFSNFTGIDTLTYRVNDGTSDSNTATVTISVGGGPSNQPPLAADDSASAPAGSSVTVAVLANDSDPDGDPLTVTNTGSPINGMPMINADNTITFWPMPGFSGQGSFTYTVSDGRGGTASATVYLTITGSNGRPTMNSVMLGNMTPKTNDTMTAWAMAADPDGDPITYSYAWKVNGVTVKTTTTASSSDALDLSQPGYGDSGDSITVTVTASDATASGTPMTSSVVSVVNSDPTAGGDFPTLVESDLAPITGNVLNNDTDADASDVLSVVSVNGIASYVSTSVAGTYGQLQINANGAYTYTLNDDSDVVMALPQGQLVVDQFAYRISDGHGGTTDAYEEVQINPDRIRMVVDVAPLTYQQDARILVRISGCTANTRVVVRLDSVNGNVVSTYYAQGTRGNALNEADNPMMTDGQGRLEIYIPASALPTGVHSLVIGRRAANGSTIVNSAPRPGYSLNFRIQGQ